MAMPDYSVNDNRVLGNILAHFAQQRPSTDFLVADDRRITYAEAYTTAQRLAAGLQAQGLSAGDRLCLFWRPGRP